ncbi:M48 family metallopeptidase [Oceanispirochaeta sp. M2]|uniref:tetratricopeptide repeat protein n=1 Tax=Oceanispirochaeta sp. M2 TaxID=2735869 RepID=UPI001552689A|nr:hypothetical protein [Oceanispirochaeta sp. M2]MBF9014187.1 hypothetical protein [Oceanispirochaeta sp. M2]
MSYIIANSVSAEAHDIKELTLAIDVFGMNPTFDTSDNSIIRVAVYKLKNKLKTYYETDGKTDAVKIKIPRGRYIADFDFTRIKEAASTEELAPEQVIQVQKIPFIRFPFIQLHFDPLNKSIFHDQICSRRGNAFNRSILNHLNYYPTIEICNDIKKCDYDLKIFYIEEYEELTIFLTLEDLISRVIIWNREIRFKSYTYSFIEWMDKNTQELTQQIGGSLGFLFRYNVERSDNEKSLYQQILSGFLRPIYTLDPDDLNNAINNTSSLGNSGLKDHGIMGGLSHLYSLKYLFDNQLNSDYLRQSRDLYKQTLLYEPNNLFALLSMTRQHYLRNDTSKLKEDTEQILKVYGISSIVSPYAAYYNAMASGEWDKQMSLIKQIIKKNPYHPKSLHTLLFLYEIRRGNLDGALCEFRKMPYSSGLPFQILTIALFAKLDRMEDVHSILCRNKVDNPDFELNTDRYLSLIKGDTQLFKSIEQGLKKVSNLESRH